MYLSSKKQRSKLKSTTITKTQNDSLPCIATLNAPHMRCNSSDSSGIRKAAATESWNVPQVIHVCFWLSCLYFPNALPVMPAACPINASPWHQLTTTKKRYTRQRIDNGHLLATRYAFTRPHVRKRNTLNGHWKSLKVGLKVPCWTPIHARLKMSQNGLHLTRYSAMQIMQSRWRRFISWLYIGAEMKSSSLEWRTTRAQKAACDNSVYRAPLTIQLLKIKVHIGA